MSEQILNEILKNVTEMREENNRRWDENDKRWEENNRRWDENDKKWEENNKRWEENNRRWEENNKRWEENHKRWQENDKRWEENDKKWKEQKALWKKNDEKWAETDRKLDDLVKYKEEGIRQIVNVLEDFKSAVEGTLNRMEEKFNCKFRSVYNNDLANSIEHDNFELRLRRLEAESRIYGIRVGEDI